MKYSFILLLLLVLIVGGFAYNTGAMVVDIPNRSNQTVTTGDITMVAIATACLVGLIVAFGG